MLSYQHAYHAGNLADVHKHALLAFALDYLTQKDKPLSYIETHGGRGLYDLTAPEAEKTGEALAAARARAVFAPDHPYARALAAIRDRHGADAYPGSPLLAAGFLRPDDSAMVAELHPQEFAALNGVMIETQVHCRQTDGLQMALAVTPPTPRRGLMLIDPSYEVKADYDTLARLVPQVHRKWNVGIIMLWYPILTDGRHRTMIAALTAAGMEKTLVSEVRFPPARAGHGMVGSGMFIVNPPFGLDAEARRVAGLFATLK